MRIFHEGKDGHTEKEISLDAGATGKDLALYLKLTGPDQALAMNVNGSIKDLDHPLAEGDRIHFLDFDEAMGKEVFWHSSAHVLAQAVLRLYPDAKPTIGPPIEGGFYYDFADLTISDEDLNKIEKAMQEIVKENHQSLRSSFKSRAEALHAFGNNPYKVELIEAVPEGVELTAYRQGEFFDLCRGPHLPNLGKIKAIKLFKVAGAYWRGDSKREMLTRIYGITFPDRTLLKEHLHRLEEAKKRDHKVLGPKYDLFSLKEEAPGMPFIHPKGMIIWNTLIDFWRELHKEAGYIEIKTPVMLTRGLWERSGHWEHYRHNMYTSTIEEREHAIKPMNCPGCMLFYKSHLHSYREFPLRIGEIGLVHRYEASGALSGLFRVRSFHQDDAHIFMTPDQITDEIVNVLELCDRLYSPFGFDYHFELSTRPEKGTIGTDEDWRVATEGLQKALEKTGRKYLLNEGDGAFYGPKIDIHLKDALGRSWQCGTVQLDMALPERFGLEYTDHDGVRRRPIMIHRALYGSLERFFGSLIEFYAGKFPFWISPRQIRLLTVADRHLAFAEELLQLFSQLGFHCELDSTGESVGKKIRNAQLEQVNYMLTVGDKEVEHGTISLRTRDGVVHGELDLNTFIEKISLEREERSLVSPFSSHSETTSTP